MCCWCCCALEVLITFSLIIFLLYFYYPTGTEARTSRRALKCWTSCSNLERKVILGLIFVHICAHDLTSYVHMCWGENAICFSHGRRLSSTSFVGIDFHPGTSCIPIIKGRGFGWSSPRSWSTLPCWQHAFRTGLRIILVTLKQCAVQPPFGIQRLGSLMVDNPSDPEMQGRKCMQPNSRRGLSLFQLMCFFYIFLLFQWMDFVKLH